MTPCAPFTNGGITADIYTDNNPYTFTLDNVTVSTQIVLPPVTANNDSYNATEGTTLNVAAPGVLGNDTGGSNTLTASLVSNVTHGTLTLNASGAFTYVPASGFTGTDSFTYKATDGGTASSAVATITVTATNSVLFTDNFTNARSVGRGRRHLECHGRKAARRQRGQQLRQRLRDQFHLEQLHLPGAGADVLHAAAMVAASADG